MTWQGSTRRQRLPPNWQAIRKRILKRDGHRCTWVDQGHRCTERATDVDHVTRGDDHRDANLRSLCAPHHAAKSAREGGHAGPRLHRPTEPHPGHT